MAKHEILIRENTGAMHDVAPYLGSYVSKETVRLGTYAASIAAKCGLPAIQVQAIVNGAFEAWEQVEQEALTRIHTDIGTICGVITGTFATSDAAFDVEVNALELALRLDDAIRLALSDVTPIISTDESITKLRLDNVVDVETVKPYNLIHGGHPTRLQGYNMVSTDAEWQAYFEDTNGVRYPFVITEDISKQLKVGHLDPKPSEGCDGKMWVVSKAGDAGGPVQTSFRKVKYLHVVDPVVAPELTGFVDLEDEPLTQLYVDNDVRAVGANLTGAGTRWEIGYISPGEGATVRDVTSYIKDGSTPERVILDREALQVIAADIGADKTLTFTVTNSAGSSVKTATLATE